MMPDSDAEREATERERERCAQIAEQHKGQAKAKRLASIKKGWKQPPESRDAVEDEERGEDIAAVEIAKAIRALPTPELKS